MFISISGFLQVVKKSIGVFPIIFCAIFIVSVFTTSVYAEGNSQEVAKKPLSKALTLESSDGNNSITFGFVLQLQFQYTSKDNGNGGDRDNNTQFRFRRIRPIIKGKLINKNLSYKVQFSTAPGAIELVDAYINYKFNKHISLMVGQHKIPFTRYRTTSVQFVDWAIVTKYFGAERQVGLSIHNTSKTPPKFEYTFGVFQGQNARKSHGVGMSMISGEELVNCSNLADAQALDELHPLVAGRFFYNHNGIVTKKDGDFKKGPFRFAAGLSASYDFRSKAYRDFSFRLAPEFLMKVRGFSFSAVYYLTMFEQDGKFSDTSIAFQSVLANAGYVINKHLELAMRFALIASSDTLRSDTQNRGAALIAAGTTPDEIQELTDQYGKAGLMKREWEATIGLNYYIFGTTLKLATDFGWQRHQFVGSDDKDDFIARMQLELNL